MSFYELAKSRYSCRSYSSKNISKEQVEKVLECARIAPSAANVQPWHFFAINKSPLFDQIASCYAGAWIKTAPVIIVACGNHAVSWRRSDGKDHCDIDLAIAIDHITLAASDMGLATCWICKFDAMKCADLLKLPFNLSPIALIPLGYPEVKNNYHERHLVRKSLDEIITWIEF
jgi:nitroreductase